MTSQARRALAERKVQELRAKHAGIGDEFDRWLADAEPARPLRKHQSQILRLTEQLRGMAGRVTASIDTLSLDGDDVLAECRALQTRMLEVHRLWDYFRSKLNLRYLAWFRRYLSVADEFAWACYEPAQLAASNGGGDGLRGPPLVYLSGDFSPFTYARHEEFEVEVVPDALDSKEFLAFAAALPIPVVGVPWYQVSHLPDVVLIAHEVGHDVESDFALEETIKAHLAPVVESFEPFERLAWETWLGEVWADLYGVLAAGPAFVSAMIDLLVTDPTQVAAEASMPSPYDVHPPAAIRVAVMTRALAETGFPDAAEEALADWAASFGTKDVDSVAAVASSVVQALLSGPLPQLGDRTLRGLVCFSCDQQRRAETVKTLALADMAPQTRDIRCLVAGARLAFDADPVGYRATDEHRVGAHERILARAVETIGDAPRIRQAERDVKPEDDRAAGEALFDRLVAATTGPRPGAQERSPT
jgi:hypothetical protein